VCVYVHVHVCACACAFAVCQLMKEYLGEGGSQCCDEVFAPMAKVDAPDFLVAAHFWYCWTEFLLESSQGRSPRLLVTDINRRVHVMFVL